MQNSSTDNKEIEALGKIVHGTTKGIHEFKVWRLMIPIVIGLGATVWMFYHEFASQKDFHFEMSWWVALSAVVGLVCMGIRDLANIQRFRMLTRPENLSWLQAFRINLLTEFSSAITPSAVGGSSLVVAFFKGEGISLGRSTAVMMSGLFLDQLFFVLTCPLMLYCFPAEELWGASSSIGATVEGLLKGVYFLLLAWCSILFLALFVAPVHIRKILNYLAAHGPLKRFGKGLKEFGDNLVESSQQLQHNSLWFWLKAFAVTAVNWTARYAVVCALLWTFAPNFGDQLIILVRQLMCWIVMTISPSPGGAGFSEYLFKTYYADYVSTAGDILIMACLWRVVTYYVYLIGGFILLPGWFKDKVLKRS